MNASNLIGSLLEGGMTGSTSGRVARAAQGGASGHGAVGDALNSILGSLGGQDGRGGRLEAGGGLGALSGGSGGQAGGLGALLGGGGSGGQAGGLGGMLGGLMGQASSVVGGQQNLAAGGAGALLGSLLGGGGGAVKGALGGGAMALLGALAYNAFMKKGDGQVAPPSSPRDVPLGLRPPETPEEEAELETCATAILEAMLNAAKADGQIDEAELDKIGGKLQEAGADPEARQFVLAEMRKPIDLDRMLAKVDGPHQAAEVYAASLLAIEVDTQAERDYLNLLAQRLGLEPEVVANLERSLGVS